MTNDAQGETLFGIAMVAILGVMIIPMPTFLLDLLLSLSISLSLIIFLFSLHIEKPLEFSAFPSILLITTLFRLALNVASTRLILLHGDDGANAVGHVIAAFGDFVIGGNTVVGVIIFAILIVINFVVITKGAGRIAEVGARFTLDSMPGKQMAVDSELAAGLINESQARERRRSIEQEADFFGAMDGASKFVRGDAVAGLLIMVVNVLGGFVIGVLQQKLSALEALRTYTSLTVGDGLVSQIPALLTSIAAGLVTTRAAAGGGLAAAMRKQLFGTRKTLVLSAGVLGAMALVPGMPHLAFLVLAGGLYLMGSRMAKEGEGTPEAVEATPLSPEEASQAEVENALNLDLLELEVGYELIPLVSGQEAGSVSKRISALRRQLAEDYGVIVPPIHLRDNLQLGPQSYRVMLSGNPLGQGELRMGKFLIIAPDAKPFQIPGEDFVDPAFSLPARWIQPGDKQRAESLSYTAVDSATVLITHLGELFIKIAPDLIGRGEVSHLLEIHSQKNSKVVEELMPSLLTTSQLVRILRNLLREKLSIRDFRTILEAIADHAAEVKDPDQLTECVRQALKKAITRKFLAEDGRIHALILAPAVENTFRKIQSSSNNAMVVDPDEVRRVVSYFEQIAEDNKNNRVLPVIVTAADIRRAVATFVNRYCSALSVISYREIEENTALKTVDIIGKDIPSISIGERLQHAV